MQNPSSTPPSPTRLLLTIAAVYALLGAIGLALALPPGYASPVFPAAGFALAVVLRDGLRVLPAIWLGSALLNVGVAVAHGTLSVTTLCVAAGIATGATLQAWAGRAFVLRWCGQTWRCLEHERSVLCFLALGGPLACAISATCGVSSLVAAGIVSPAAIGYAWWNWYVGDTLGVLIAAPFAIGLLLRHQHASWRTRLKTMLLPFMAVLGLAAAMFFASAHWEAATRQRDLEERGRSLAHAFQNHLGAHEAALASLARFIELTPDVGPEQFAHFTTATLRDNPQFSALSFSPYLTLAEREDFERRMAELSPEGRFEITESDGGARLIRAGERADYVSIAYIAPQEGNLAAIGFDNNSEPLRRDAVQRASQCGRMAATAPVRLVQSRHDGAGLLLLASACSRGGWPVERPLQRALLGFVAAAIKIDEMVETATRGQAVAGLVIELNDPMAEAGHRVLYRSGPDSVVAEGTPEWSTHLTAADRTWVLRVLPGEGYLQAHRPWMAWAVGVAGMLFGALLQVLLLAVTGRAAVVQRRVDEQTIELRAKNEALEESENRYRSVVDNVKEVIFQTDARGAWTYLNPAWTEVTGFPLETSLGTPLLDYVHPDDRERNAGLFAPLVEGRKDYCRHEIRCLHEQGGFRWIEVFARPTVDRNGIIVGTSGTLTDITERRQAEADLRASEAALQLAQTVAQLGSWELDIETDRFVLSAEAHRIFDMPRGEPVTVKRFFDRVHPDDRIRMIAAWTAALAGAPYDIEHRIVVAGRTLWLNERAELKFDGAGKAVYALGTVQDITARKLLSLDLEAHRNHLDALVKARTAELQSARDALAIGEAQYRGLVESPMAGIFILELDGFRYVNPTMAQMHGCASPEEMIALGRPEQWIAAEDVERVMDNSIRVLNGGQPGPLQFSGLRRDGSTLALETYATLARYEGRPAIAGLVLDISARKAMEAALARENERFRVAVEAAPMAILMADAAGRIVLANPMLENMFGYTPGELLGRPVEALAPAALRARHVQLRTAYQAAPGAARTGQGRELQGQRKDGSEFPVEIGLSHMVLGDARLTLAVISDISEHKAAIARQEQARAAAEAASLAKSSFLANMSHEIRTPLTAIAGMAHLIRREPLSDKQIDRLNKLDAAGRHLTEVINAILELSKIEAGKYDLAEQRFNLDRLVRQVADMLHERIQAKRIEFTVDMAVEHPSFVGDATRLQQALLNYVNNAVKFTDAGSIALRVLAEKESEDEALLRFEVEDSGIGIAADVLPRLFAPFEQADNSATRKYGGTGLGLAITKKLAELMGGWAGAYSTPGRGSTFWFTARVKKARPAITPSTAAELAEATLRRDYPGRRVLLVEDEPINREIVQLCLEGTGLQVELACDGADAVRVAASKRFDLILMDMKMPRMDGLEATRRILALGIDTPIVALTANVFAEDRASCLASGMVDFVTKPIDVQTLLSVVLKWLAAREARAQAAVPALA